MAELTAKTRKKLTDKLGLPADAGDAEVLTALDNRLTAQAESTVAAAISNGKILAAHGDYWRAAFKRDHCGTKKVLDSLSSVPTAAAAALTTAASTAAPSAQPVFHRDPLDGVSLDRDNPTISAASTASEYELISDVEHLAIAGSEERQRFVRGSRLTGVAQADIARLVQAGAAAKVGKMDRRDPSLW